MFHDGGVDLGVEVALGGGQIIDRADLEVVHVLVLVEGFDRVGVIVVGDAPQLVDVLEGVALLHLVGDHIVVDLVLGGDEMRRVAHDILLSLGDLDGLADGQDLHLGFAVHAVEHHDHVFVNVIVSAVGFQELAHGVALLDRDRDVILLRKSGSGQQEHEHYQTQ